jgi:VIT1/CCC1 family predicted Fe2+/Mn2+ transporter
MVQEIDKKALNDEHMTADGYGWISDFVYGGIDGAVTTFAIVSGVQGASLPVSVILILGFANVLADGLSMAVGKYSSDKAEIEQFNRIKAVEYEHVAKYPEHELEEVRDFLREYGFKGRLLESTAKQIASDPDGWIDFMMRHEFNMAIENVSPVKGAFATFGSFVLIGFIPLAIYVVAYVFDLDFANNSLFFATSILTLVALFIVGVVKSRFTVRNWFLSGLETAFLGGLAASVSYFVGYLLKDLSNGFV